MNLTPVTLEGRTAWLLAVLGIVGGAAGLGMFFRHGAENLQTIPSAKLLYPFALLSARLTGSFWGIPVFVLFLQFLIYALVVTVGGALDRLRPTAVLVGLAHISAALCCFL